MIPESNACSEYQKQGKSNEAGSVCQNEDDVLACQASFDKSKIAKGSVSIKDEINVSLTRKETKSKYSSRKEDIEMKKREKLLLLEEYRNKLCNNLQSIEKNNEELLNEANRLSDALDDTCKDFDNPKENINSCYAEKSTEISRAICTEVNYNDEYEKEKQEVKVVGGRDFTKEDEDGFVESNKSHCYKCLLTSSDESCGYQQLEDERTHDCYYYEPKKKAVDYDSANTSSGRETLCSATSKYTCFCSKNESHEYLTSESNSDVKVFRKNTRKRSRRPIRTGQAKEKLSHAVEHCEYQYKNLVIDNLKLVKVDELREGLQLLKIRNRNLKDFLDTLQNPLRIVKNPLEITSVCAAVTSTNYAVEQTNQSPSNLVALVKVLENKCRNKDAIIAALADEIQSGIDVMSILKGIKIEPSESKLIKNVLSRNEKSKFSTKDSVLGFIFFAMILVSHIKVSQIMYYLHLARKSLNQTALRLLLFIKRSRSYVADHYLDYGHLQKRLHYVVDRINEMNYHSLAALVLNNQHQIAFTTSIIFSIILVVNLATRNLSKPKIAIARSRDKFFNNRKLRDPEFWTTSFLLAYNQIWSSKLFWIVVGFSLHVLWNMVSANFIGFVDLFIIEWIEKVQLVSQAGIQDIPDNNNPNDNRIFTYPNYSWLLTMCSLCFQNVLQSFYNVFDYVSVQSKYFQLI